MTIPPFTLPSDQARTITLREATVSECLDFADIDPDHEEEVTTLFLNRLQDKATFFDSKQWTGDDRRFGLFWYWLHTTDDVESAIVYSCRHCGKDHTYLLDYRKLADGYTSIKGLPARDVTVQGRPVLTVKPIDGAGQEHLETCRMALVGKRTIKDRLRVERLALASGLPTKEILDMPHAEYADFCSQVESALDDMKHGLDSDYVDGTIEIILPPHQCPNIKEASTQVRVLFRAIEWIPVL